MIRTALTVTALAVVAACVTVCVIVGLRTNHSYVDTPSMYPTIPPGSEIFYSAQDSYQVGDVIVFRANGITWAHRLVKINRDGTYVTKGDNPQNAPDVFVPALTQDDVIGAVTRAPRWIGFPALIAHRPGYGVAWLRTELGVQGRIVLVGVVALLSLLYVLAGPGRGSRRGRRHRSPGPGDAVDGEPAASEDAAGEPEAGWPESGEPEATQPEASEPKASGHAVSDTAATV